MRNNKESFKLSSVLVFHLHGNHIELCLRIIKPQQKGQIITRIKRQNPVKPFNFISIDFSSLRIFIKGTKNNGFGRQLCLHSSICLSADLDLWMQSTAAAQEGHCLSNSTLIRLSVHVLQRPFFNLINIFQRAVFLEIQST